MTVDNELKGEHLRWLRNRANLKQQRLAELLRVTQRTLTKWESDNLSVSSAYIPIIQIVFEKYCLIPFAKALADQAFKEVCRSELVAVWFVKYTHISIDMSSSGEALLLEDTARYQCLCTSQEEKEKCTYASTICRDKDHCFRTDRQSKPLVQTSLTTAPLRSGRIANLAGEAINDSPHKRMPGRTNHFYKNKTVHSILHVPLLVEGPDHPNAVALLSMENKLEKNANGIWSPKDECVYNTKEELKAQAILRNAFEERRWPDPNSTSVRNDDQVITEKETYSGTMLKHLFVFNFLEWLPADLQDNQR